MKVFKVDKKDRLDWCMDYSMVVVAEDKDSAERCARLSSEDFRNAKIEVIEINLEREQCILKANTGA